MPSYLITGTSRGLGLAFAAELLKNPDNIVVATARNTASSPGLRQLFAEHNDERLILLDLDVTSQESVRKAAEKTAQLVPNGVDHLISNAGVNLQPLASFDDINLDGVRSEIDFNITAPILLIRAFLPLIRKGSSKKILIITSTLGSISNAIHLPGLGNAYSIAKAGLNMLARKWASVLQNDGITTILIHPGWVGATEMGASITEYIHKYAPDTPNVSEEASAEGCMKVLNEVTMADNGEFFQFDGEKLPF